MLATRTVRVIDSRGLRVRVVAGRPVPAHLRTAYEQAIANAAPTTAAQRSPQDDIATLKRPALMQRAAALGVPAKGTNAAIIAAIRHAARS